MTLKSKQVITGSRLVKSRSSDNLPTSQSQVNIQMMSHTLTIREVSFVIYYVGHSLYLICYGSVFKRGLEANTKWWTKTKRRLRETTVCARLYSLWFQWWQNQNTIDTLKYFLNCIQWQILQIGNNIIWQQYYKNIVNTNNIYCLQLAF